MQAMLIQALRPTGLSTLGTNWVLIKCACIIDIEGYMLHLLQYVCDAITQYDGHSFVLSLANFINLRNDFVMKQRPPVNDKSAVCVFCRCELQTADIPNR